MCVDDNRDCADSAVLLLNLVGFDAMACRASNEALTVNQISRPGIYLIDVHMPSMDVDELATRFQKRLGWHPRFFVAVTMASEELSRERTHAADFDIHLVKSVNPASSLYIVEGLLKVIDGNRQTGNTSLPDDMHISRRCRARLVLLDRQRVLQWWSTPSSGDQTDGD
jgi:CheY-like chemotaxis protein